MIYLLLMTLDPWDIDNKVIQVEGENYLETKSTL